MIEQAKWITCGSECEAPVFEKRFALEAPVSGTVEITGLGWFELYCNGRRVSEDRFVPVVSDYQSRDFSTWLYPLHDRTVHRVYYLEYDLSEFLCEGENVLQVVLGNGWYRQKERQCEGKVYFGEELKTCFAAEICCEEKKVNIFSDGSETWVPSEILYNNLFIGEIQDARLLRSPKTPRPVKLLPTEEDVSLCRQTCPPDRVIRTQKPRLLHSENGISVYDAGENISGWVRVKTSGRSGERICLRFSEELHEDGSLDTLSAGDEYICVSGRVQIQQDEFICDGTERCFEPRFVFHAFRYFEVSGPTEELTVVVVHSDVAVISSFSSDCEGMNYLYEAYIRTELGNMHSGIPSDCPHRERLGYTGDGQITAETAMLLLDSKEFYRKWIQDILDCQDPESGHVQHTAPMMGGGGGPGGWGCAVVIVPYRFYQVYGEREILEQSYPHMRKWIAYLQKRMENGLVVREEEKGWCLGDWATLEPIQIPEPYVNTCYLILSLRMMEEIAVVLNRKQEAEKWKQLREEAEKSVKKAYFEAQSGSFCGGIQGADAYAVLLELGDRRTLANLIEKYETESWFDVGFLGIDFLMDALLLNGGENTAFRLLDGEGLGTFLWQKRKGATTLWEKMNGGSHNHPMFGAITRFLFSRILGIRQEEGTVGYQNLLLKPVFPEGLHFAEGTLKLACGTVTVRWKESNGTILMEAELPKGVPVRLEYNGKAYPARAGLNNWILKK